MGDAGAAIPDPRGVLVGHVVRVGEDRSRPEQPEGVERRRVRGAESLERMTVGPVRLRSMGLDERPGRRGERAEPAQQPVRAGRGEARGDDRPDESPAGIDGVDRVDGPGAGTDAVVRRRIAIPGGRAFGVVHRHPAHERALARIRHRLGEGRRRVDIDRREVRGGRRPVAEQPLDQVRPDGPGEREVRVAGLQREGVLEEPALQRQVQAGARVAAIAGRGRGGRPAPGSGPCPAGSSGRPRRRASRAAPAGLPAVSTAVISPRHRPR